MTAIALLLTLFVNSQAYDRPADLATYYLYFLREGPNYGQGSKDDQTRLQQQHLAHLTTLSDAGIIRIAGPLDRTTPRRGVVVLQETSLERARAQAEADPAVKAGTFAVELYTLRVPGNWFGFGPIPDPFTPRKFVLFLLEPVPNASEAARDALADESHLRFVHELRAAGQLELFGTLADEHAQRELGVLRTEDVDAARGRLEADPAVSSGRMRLTVLGWFAGDRIMQRR